MGKKKKMTPAQAASARRNEPTRSAAGESREEYDSGLNARTLFFRLVLPLICIVAVVVIGTLLHLG